MIADPAALGAAVAIVAGARTVRFTWSRAVLAVPATAALPIAFALAGHHDLTPPTPTAGATPTIVSREQVPGQVTIVEFVDFECPFCRALAPKLAEAIERAPVPVRVVRKMVPLHQHPHARDAALAWCCADAQGKADAMASALFAASADELTPEGCETLAVSIGCDRDLYRATLADPKLAVRIDRDIADARAAGVRGFPTVFIGDTRILGANHEPADLIATIARAHR
jgi:protein-disulfide isomerase